MATSTTRLLEPVSPRTKPSLHPLLRFALIATGLYLVWFFGYEHYLAVDGRLDYALTQNIADAAASVLRMFGFDASNSATQHGYVLLDQRPAAGVGAACDGMVLYALFSGFVLAFPSSSWHKLWFIPMGVLLIYSINVLRVVALSINYYYSQETVEFNHHYTFTFIVYGFIAMLWAWWATRLAAPVSNNSSLASNAYA